MPSDLERILIEFRNKASYPKALILSRFFKTGKGQYGEGDKFLGIVVPKIRSFAKNLKDLSISNIQRLIKSKYHEERLLALFILVSKFEDGDIAQRRKIFNFYLANTRYINNWDLVDSSAYKIVGAFLSHNDISLLSELAYSENIWERRISMISTFAFIKEKRHKPTFEIGGILVKDKSDLIQKALGWMLREVGKHCGEDVEDRFLKKYGRTMGRTALRYAIERYDSKKRKEMIQTTKL